MLIMKGVYLFVYIHLAHIHAEFQTSVPGLRRLRIWTVWAPWTGGYFRQLLQLRPRVELVQWSLEGEKNQTPTALPIRSGDHPVEPNNQPVVL